MQNNNSKLNVAILCIIVLLVILGIVLMNKKDSQMDAGSESDRIISIDNSLPAQAKSQSNSSQDVSAEAGNVFENPGFSLIVPEKYKEIFDLTSDNNSVSKGTIGKSMRKYFTKYPDPFFYVAGMTTDYSGDRGVDCGETKRYPAIQEGYEQRTNKQGVFYMYKYESDVDGYFGGPHQLAYFKLNNSEFPVLGFCASANITEADFTEVINSVKIK